MTTAKPPRSLLSLVLVLAAATTTPAAFAAPPPEAGQQPAADLIKAYQNLDRYQATTQVKMLKQGNQWDTSREGEIKVAFDRKHQRLAIEHPAARVVVKDGTLYMKTPMFDGHHLEKPISGPITYRSLQKAVPFLGNPPLIDVASLLAEDPIAALSGGQSVKATPMPGKDGKAPSVKFDTKRGTMVVRFTQDPPRLTRATLEYNTSRMNQGSNPAPKTMTATYHFETKSAGEELDDKLFAFKTKGSKAADSLRALVQNARSSGSGGGGGRGGHALTGTDAPSASLQTMDGESFSLKENEAKVVIFDFWATWCPPCRKALPKLQAVADWAEENDKSVAVYAVNVRESKEKAKQFWQDNGYTMPVLMDKQGKVAKKYQVSGIPQTVVIANGKVKAVHVGYNPSMKKTLKKEISEAMGGGDQASDDNESDSSSNENASAGG